MKKTKGKFQKTKGKRKRWESRLTRSLKVKELNRRKVQSDSDLGVTPDPEVVRVPKEKQVRKRFWSGRKRVKVEKESDFDDDDYFDAKIKRPYTFTSPVFPPKKLSLLAKGLKWLSVMLKTAIARLRR